MRQIRTLEKCSEGANTSTN